MAIDVDALPVPVGRADRPQPSDAPDIDEKRLQLLHVLHALSDGLGRVPLKSLVSEAVSIVECHYIESALALTDGNRSAAAKMLGLSRQSLYMKLTRYGIGDD